MSKPHGRASAAAVDAAGPEPPETRQTRKRAAPPPPPPPPPPLLAKVPGAKRAKSFSKGSKGNDDMAPEAATMPAADAGPLLAGACEGPPPADGRLPVTLLSGFLGEPRTL
jgi:hypothetical protein